MPDYEVNQAAVRRARELIDGGDVDTGTEWSTAAPSTEQGNEVIEEKGWEEFAAWHLAVDPGASEETKGRFAFPYGDFRTVNRAALIHAKQRASQNGHEAVEQAAGDLLDRLDARD
ncbi:hypothetical protein ACI8AF_18380 [Blastococcus sp. SYSU D00669]